MSLRNFINKKLTLFVFALAVVMFVLSLAGNNDMNDSARMADKVSHRIEKRLEILDGFVNQACSAPVSELVMIDNLPSDMVIYRYVNDSLQSWCNQFPILNDDISSKLVFQRLGNPRNSMVSPLVDVTDTISYMNLGQKSYVVKARSLENGVRVIAGLEIKDIMRDDLLKGDNGVNGHLKLPSRFAISSLESSGGSPVVVDGVPLFQITTDTNLIGMFNDLPALRWISLFLFVFSTILFLNNRRTLKVYMSVMAAITIFFFVAFIWIQQMPSSSDLFSPTLFADGSVFSSLGALLLVNTYITAFNVCTYLVRARTMAIVRKDDRHRRRNLAIHGLCTLVALVITAFYIIFSLKSLILNSKLTLELYRLSSELLYNLLVYMSYTGLLFCLVLEIQMLRPSLKEFFNLRYDMFDRKALVLCAFLFTVFFVSISSILGLSKEKDRVSLWSNRLAIDRDLALEIQLRMMEDNLASDPVIASLVSINNPAVLIQNRISEYYFGRMRQSYSVDVSVYGDSDREGMAEFNSVLLGGSPVADNSKFFYMTDASGHSYYVGAFLYWTDNKGLVRLLARIEAKSNREDKGYVSLLGRYTAPGEIQIPAYYSYAKYIGGRLVSYKGNYPYPTRFSSNGQDVEKGEITSRVDGYRHFINIIDSNEVIVMSRPRRNVMVFFTSFSYLFLALSALLYLCGRSRVSKYKFRNNYFRKRINLILLGTSCLILVSLMTISVVFVFKRNETNQFNLMSSRINTVQALVNARTRNITEWRQMLSSDFQAQVENISNTTKSDITFFTPSGKVFYSTTPEVFERMILGSRIDQNAYYNIRYLNQRYHIHGEKMDNIRYWSLYAPMFNDSGQLLAIMGIPYTEKVYDFRRETFFHAAMIFNIFILLLIISLLFTAKEVNSLMEPLAEMDQKMKRADIHNLEYIVYKRQDEITSLVESYNRMVRDLSESTRLLAQAERDKAWSLMARQVAHEIKNPLTPIKLEIQRLIRLKQKNNPAWEEKFDKVAEVVLEHIDILTDTANEFSTFAKLYSEEPVLINLDKVIQDQILIFDNKENIKIQYFGLENAWVKAPKPQMIRVFVNLLANAVQAVEIMQREALDKGETPSPGRIVVCLRNSVKDGFYDVVFDDNGPGVGEENLGKLFTPNFTTKSSGTGLGLAICRNIVEKCEGEIRYSRSFALGGASFTVSLHKSEPPQTTA